MKICIFSRMIDGSKSLNGARSKWNKRQVTTERVGTGERIAINIDLEVLMACNMYLNI